MDFLICPCFSLIQVFKVQFVLKNSVNFKNVAYLNLILQKLAYRKGKKLFRDYTLIHSDVLQALSRDVTHTQTHSNFSYRTPPRGYRCSRPQSLTRRLTQTSTCVPYLPTSRRTMPPILTLPPRGDTWTERLDTLLKSMYVTVKHRKLI